MAEDGECDELLQQLVSAKEASVTGGLILKLERFLKKPTIEDGLSEVLIEYLQHLRTSKIYLSNGIFTINFAECALLLQSASNLYAKKVDLLWDCIIAYQERNVLYEERSETTETEFKKVEERKERFKRKRKKKELEAPQAIQEIVLPNHEEMLDRIWKDSNDLTDDFFNSTMESVDVRNKDNHENYFGRWYTRENLRVSSNQCPLLMKDICRIKENKVLDRTEFYWESPIYNIPITGLNSDGDEETLFQYSELNMNYLNRNDKDLVSIMKRIDGIEEKYTPANVLEYCTQLFISLYKIPVDSIYADPEKFWQFYKDFRSKLPPPKKAAQTEETEKETEKSDPKAVAEPPAEANQTQEGESNCDIRPGDDASKLNRQDPIRKTTESSDSGFFDGESECHGGLEGDKSGRQSARVTPANTPIPEPDFLNVPDTHVDDTDSAVHSELQSPNVTVVEEVVEMCKIVKKRKKKENLEEEEPRVKPKRIRKQLFKTRPVHTTKMKKFEAFFSNNYKAEDGEGTVVPVEYSDSEDEGDHIDTTLAPANESSIMDTTLESAPSDVTPSNAPVNDSVFLNASMETTETANESSNVNTTTPPVNDSVNADQNTPQVIDDDDDEDDDQVRLENYLKWKEFIEKEVKSQAEVQLDIHEKGTEIIECIGTIGNTVKYSDMCKGKTSREVTHSFIAMLQLANTYNVEIKNAKGGTLANDTLELKLLSKERHHENLCEYQAPSEVTLNDRLKQAKRAALNYQSSSGSSGNSQQPSARIYKKIRLG